MKKLAKFLLPILVLSSMNLSGCNKNKDKRILLSFGDVHTTGYKTINIDKLSEIISNEESFMIVINSTTCGCWDNFEPNLTKYVKDNKLLCYQVAASDFLKLDFNDRYGLTNVTSSTTTFAVFEKGKLKTSINTKDKSTIMYDYKNFSKYMSETIILPKCFFIEKDDVEVIKTSTKNAVIYFERSGCGDCNTLNPTILHSYIKNHPNMNKIYVLDCQQYWRSRDAEDYSTYIAFKDEMGLSIANNPIYGFDSGVFPFFSYIENGDYKSGCVIYNDTIEDKDGKTVISNSYYTLERKESLDYTDVVLQGKEIPANEISTSANGYKTWNYDAQNKYYGDILSSFLDTKLPLVNYNF